MSRLSSRPDYNATNAARFEKRCSESHEVEWKANVYRGDELIEEDLPVIGGSLVLDSSDPIRRRLRLEVGGEEFAPRTRSSPLVPFGQRIVLWVRIDEANGTDWFPWLKMGEFHIVTHTFERPSKITTVECVDMSGAVDEVLFLRRRSFVDQTIRHAIQSVCEEAVPDYIFGIDSSDASNDDDRALKNYVSEAGQGRWEACTQMARRRGHEVFFDANGDLIIRHDVTDDNDESIPGNGPDIGMVSDPIAIITDETNGNLVGMTATVSRQGGCNGVRINLHSTVPKKVRKQADRESADPVEWRTAPISAFAQELQEEGPVRWGDMFGKLPIVIERNIKDLKKWSDGGAETWSNAQQDAHADAKRILHRRRGVTRYLDLHVLPLYWLEPDDRVRIRWHEFEDDPDYRVTQEAHFVQRIEIPLAAEQAGPMVLRTRQLNVTDPG